MKNRKFWAGILIWEFRRFPSVNGGDASWLMPSYDIAGYEFPAERSKRIVDFVRRRTASRTRSWYHFRHSFHEYPYCHRVDDCLKDLDTGYPCCVVTLYIDDGSTMGVLHPETPVELAGILQDPTSKASEVVDWMMDHQDTTAMPVVGQDASHTCEKCGGLVTSGATRQSIFWSCTQCGDSSRVDNPANPCPR